MNGREILNYLLKDSISLSKFRGIYAIDKLNFKLPDAESFFVCNTDESYKKGKHWVIIYINSDKNVVEYFDSLGKKPAIRFKSFMRQDNRYILYSHKKLQGVYSESCGFFCLYFVYLRCRGVDYKSLLNSFSKSLNANEKYVTDFIKQNLT